MNTVHFQSRRLWCGFQGEGETCFMLPMISNMAELIWVNLSGIIEDSAKNDLAKQIFAKIKKIKKLQYLGSPVFLVATHAKAKQNRQARDNYGQKSTALGTPWSST